MKNKTTTELLELLRKLPDEGEKIWGEGGKYEQIMGELRTRYPFNEILDPDWDTSLPAVWEEIEDLKAEIKKLKRHKHEPNTGDVLVRI